MSLLSLIGGLVIVGLVLWRGQFVHPPTPATDHRIAGRRLADRRCTDRWDLPTWLVVAALVIMVALALQQLLHAQTVPLATQDGINALLLERQASLSGRLDKIENMLQAIVIGVFLQLVAVLGWMMKARKG